MCGFAGKIWLEAGRPADSETADRMGSLVAHRGPDEAKSMTAGEAAFAFQRLAIIDVAGGHQPLQNEDGRYTLVFNGEIYNYRELMKDLEGRGHRFATRCDAEVVVHLYEEKGPECVAALEGMFAFAVWDREERVLFLARDRTGKKPLYWAKLDDAVIFASELKSLLQESTFKRSLNHRALREYLLWQYVPAPMTIFEQASKLEPGTWVRMQFGRNGGGPEIRSETYWELHYEPKTRISTKDAEQQVRERLDRAVGRRLESEVPLGILLSGGVDSSAITASARQHIAGPLRTFSIGFEEKGYNELPHARRVASLFETEHEELIVRPDTLDVLPELAWYADEPFGDSSALPTYYLARMTRRHVTVALGGDGGDESFAGYARYQVHPVLAIWRRLPRGLRGRLLRSLIRSARRRWKDSHFFKKAQHVNEFSLLPQEQHYGTWLRIFPPQLLAPLLAGAVTEEDLSRNVLTHEAIRRSDAIVEIDQKMACDVATYLPGDLLHKIDRMSMAHGLEVRCPFLDRELMEFAARLPAGMKFPGGELKGLLKDAMEERLPHDLLDRPKKGFSVPLHRWFRKELKDMPAGILLSERARQRGLFDEESVKLLIEQHQKGVFDHAHRLWLLIEFEAWAQTFLDPATPPTGPVDAVEVQTV